MIKNNKFSWLCLLGLLFFPILIVGWLINALLKLANNLCNLKLSDSHLTGWTITLSIVQLALWAYWSELPYKDMPIIISIVLVASIPILIVLSIIIIIPMIKLLLDIFNKLFFMVKTNKARTYYDIGIEYYTKKKYQEAYNYFINAQNLIPDNPDYKKKTNEAKLEIDKQEAEKYYNDGMNYLSSEDYFNAISAFENALKLQPQNTTYKEALNNPYLQNICKANKYYNEGIKYFNRGQYQSAYNNFINAEKLSPDNMDYKNKVNETMIYLMKTKEIHETKLKFDKIEKAKEYYNKGMEYFNNGDYQEAYSNFINAQNLITDNSDYKNMINKTKLIIDKKEAEEYYRQGMSYFNNSDYDNAICAFEIAIMLQPNNIKYEEALNKANVVKNKFAAHDTSKSNIQDNKKQANQLKDNKTTNKVNILNCAKSEILSLDGFDENKATKFINDRNNGKMWYNIDDFVNDFGLQPHELVLIQDRLLFPLKQAIKQGRKVDW